MSSETRQEDSLDGTVNVCSTCWPWGFSVEPPGHWEDSLSYSTECSRCPAARCYTAAASSEGCGQHCKYKRLIDTSPQTKPNINKHVWYSQQQLFLLDELSRHVYIIKGACFLSTNLEGREDPRSEKPFVRVSSSGQGLLGVKSTSSPSP